ncbi:hypothetical protein E4T56_gene18958 [Termitomyces sp. T112]|nr:hypothetical protein E4T56_gene18958 [Termitomyces sp. T112]
MDYQSLCFSTIPILRCEFSTKLEVLLLIIPTAIEVLVATLLLIANWGSGRLHLWIVAEEYIYFLLALIEMLSHILPAVRDHLDVFNVFDTILATASSVPIFCYLFFGFLFAREELIYILPCRFRTISSLMLLISIPAIVALNESASLIGISHGLVHVDKISIISNRFLDDKDKNIWTFFTSLTLALLVAYQSITFWLTFYRFIKAILNQRRIETTASNEVQLLRGTGWIMIGLKLGAIESVIGFAANGFGSAMTRRIMRLLARASLITGLIKGLDTTEDSTNVEEPTGIRNSLHHSRLRNPISSARHDTLPQLSPAATALRSSPRTPQDLNFFTLSESRSVGGLPDSERFVEVKESSITEKRVLAGTPVQQRVTIHLKNGAPRLEMRFSAFEIPEFPIHICNHFIRSATEVAKKPRSSASRPVTLHADPSNLPPPSKALDLRPMPRKSPDIVNGIPLTKITSDLQSSSNVIQHSSRVTRSESLCSTHARDTMDSYTSSSTVRDLTSQFPPLPARIHEAINQSAANNGAPVDFCDDSPSVAKSTEFVSAPFVTGGKSLESAPITRHLDDNTPDSIVTTPTTTFFGYMTTPALSMLTALDNKTYVDFGSARHSMKTRAFARNCTGVVAPTREAVDWIDFDGISSPPAVIGERSEGQTLHSRRSGSSDSIRISWLQNPEEPQLVQAVSLKSQVARIKSIGKAPIRVTPRPVKNAQLRGSLHLEQIQALPREDTYHMKVIQGGWGTSYEQSVMRDSDVLGMEELNHTHYQHANDRRYI